MEQQGNARVQRSVAAQWGLQQCEKHRDGCNGVERHKGGCSNARATKVFAATQRQQREHRIATKVDSTTRDF